MSTDALKRLAGEYAARFVQSGMVIGLGTGSTAIHATRRIAQGIHKGELRDIRAIPTSRATEAAARQLGIPLSDFAEIQRIDMTIDGADEVDPALNLIKGGGGALLREKIVAQRTDEFVIVVDASKLSPRLGTIFAVPMEVLPFGWQGQARWLESLGAVVTLRLDAGGTACRTDQDNFILDCAFGAIDDAAGLSRLLNGRAGIVEHGLFIGMAGRVVVAGADFGADTETFGMTQLPKSSASADRSIRILRRKPAGALG